MKLMNHAMLIATEEYHTQKGGVYTKVLLTVPGSTEASTLIMEGLDMLGTAPGTLWKCTYNYSEKYGQLKLLAMESLDAVKSDNAGASKTDAKTDAKTDTKTA